MPAESGAGYRYRLFGLEMRSGIELPELQPCEETGPADVEIVLGPLAFPAGPPGLSLIEGGALLTVPGVARYGMFEGRRILVDPEAGRAPRDVRLFLIGSAFGALLHQRGILPLHANAIVLGGRAIAFLGRSGSGKSTMAAWFHDEGHRLLADDVCAVGFEGGRALAYPGVPRLRLWRDALEASGRDAAGFEPAMEGVDKFNVPARGEAAAGAAPLHRLFVLKKLEAGGEPEIRRLAGADALQALVSNTYRGEFLRVLGGADAHFAACLKLLRSCPVYEAGLVWGRERLDGQLRAVARHAMAA